VDMGCQYVQGFFFCRPELMRGKGLVGSHPVYQEFLREIARPQLELGRLEEIIKQDLSLTYKLLRYINSTAPPNAPRPASLKQGLSSLGEQRVRKWGTLAALTSGGRSRPSELVLSSLVRARFCEAVGAANRMTDRPLDLFAMGLLSYVDAIADLPMEHVLSQMAVSDAVRQVLLQDPAAPKELAQIKALAQACERGAWGKVIETCAGMRITQPELAVLYYDAVGWAEGAF
jgi:c-di-GMP-related signal transduction protein